MKRKRYSVEQIVAAVRQHELGVSAADIAAKLGIAEQTFYRWKKQYGGLEASEVRELKQLREENAKLKRLYCQEGLQLRPRRPRRHVSAATRQPPRTKPRAPTPNAVLRSGFTATTAVSSWVAWSICGPTPTA